MDTDFVAFLRAISNVPMQPFRDALTGIGLADVRSFGGTGNLMFRASDADRADLEQQIAAAVGTDTYLRTREELATIVANDPFSGMPRAGVFFAHGEFDAARVDAFLGGGFDGEPPAVSGAQVYFVYPLRRPGHKGNIDLERELDSRGTMRASTVVARVLQLM